MPFKPNLTLIALLLLLPLINIFASKIDDPAPITFGEISKDDFNFNIADYPDFDPASAAIILSEYGQEFYSEFAGSYQTRFIVHRRILVLKKEGVEEADVEIWFRAEDNIKTLENAFSSAGKYGPFWITGKDEGIFKLKAMSYNLDEQGNIERSELDRSTVHVQDATDMVGYDAVSFAIPNVRVGTIIEYTYTKVNPNFLFSRGWFFQHSIPCIHSEFRIAYRETNTYAVIRNGLLRREIEPVDSELTTKQFNKFKQKIYKFELDSIPGMPEQELVSTMDNYRAHIIIQLQRYWNYNRGEYKKVISTWEELAKEYLKKPEFGKQLFRFDNLFEEIKDQLLQPETAEDEIEVCFNFVRDYFLWNGKYRRMPTHNLKEVFENREASGVEINMFLARLLREFGINSKLAFVSTRENGWVNENYPFILQFNHVITTVEIDGKIYFLDAINKQRSFNIPPANIIDTKVFILDLAEPKIVKAVSDVAYDQMIVLNIEINDKEIQGKVQGRFKGYSALQRRIQIANDSVKFMRDYLFDNSFDSELDSPVIINFQDKEKPLLTQVGFSSSDAIQFLDSLLIIEPANILFEVDSPLSYEKRDFPVELNFRRNIQKLISITIPEDYFVESLPAPEKLMLDDGSAVVTVIYQKSQTAIQIKMVLRTNNLIYSSKQYSRLKDIFDLWENLNNEPIVLTRK